MKFGIHSLLFTETFLEKDLPLLEKCKRMGFDAVELIPFDPDHFPAVQVRRLAVELDLTINTGYGLPAEYNTISPLPALRVPSRKGGQAAHGTPLHGLAPGSILSGRDREIPSIRPNQLHRL